MAQSNKRRKPRRKHDEVLKGFFSAKAAARSLVQEFLAGGWAGELDLASMEDVPTEHIGLGGQARRADAAWRVRLRDSARSVVFHVEFQSAVDPNMLLRSFEYVGHLYKFLSRDGSRTGGGVPVVLSGVLYIGSKPWDAPTATDQLAPPGSPTLARLQTRHRYAVLDVRSAPKRNLPCGGSVLRWLADLLRDWRALPRLVDALAEDYSGPEHADVREGFAMVAEEALLAGGASLDVIRNVVEQIKKPNGGTRMSWQIAEEFERTRREGHYEGREEGRREGRREGRHEGQADFAVRSAARKFGAEVADELRRVLATAGPEAAEHMADAIIDCETADELLASTMHRGRSTD